MSASNLAKVFGPTIVGNSSTNLEPMQLLREAKWQPKVLSILDVCGLQFFFSPRHGPLISLRFRNSDHVITFFVPLRFRNTDHVTLSLHSSHGCERHFFPASPVHKLKMCIQFKIFNRFFNNFFASNRKT